jgi:drug/metabolite transporter (DMT)-like permease
LVLGIASVGLLMRDGAVNAHGSLVIGSIAILVGALSWAIGVMYSRSPSLPNDPVARAGMAAMSGAVLLLVTSVATGEMAHAHPSHFSARSVWALLYLITFGSIIAFTAYTWLLDHCSPTLVSTHTYANPIIAVLLGWGFAGEVLDGRVVGAAGLTLLAVFLINRGTGNKQVKQVQEKAAA